MPLTLSIILGEFTIHRFPADYPLPEVIFNEPFFSISRTRDELSVVCASSVQLESDRSDSDWACIKVLGPLDFSLTGILAKISAVLAEAKISIFALSTYDTDYILVKSNRLVDAQTTLIQAGYCFAD